MEVELPSGQRLLAETLLTVPVGADSGYVGLAFFWRDGVTPTTAAAIVTARAGVDLAVWRCERNSRKAKLHESRVEQQAQIAEIAASCAQRARHRALHHPALGPDRRISRRICISPGGSHQRTAPAPKAH